MKLYNNKENKECKNIDLIISVDEAEEFLLRLNDLANNPSYDRKLPLEDYLMGDGNEIEPGYSKTEEDINMYIYSQQNFAQYPDWIKNLIRGEIQ